MRQRMSKWEDELVLFRYSELSGLGHIFLGVAAQNSLAVSLDLCFEISF